MKVNKKAERFLKFLTAEDKKIVAHVKRERKAKGLPPLSKLEEIFSSYSLLTDIVEDVGSKTKKGMSFESIVSELSSYYFSLIPKEDIQQERCPYNNWEDLIGLLTDTIRRYYGFNAVYRMFLEDDK